MAFARAEYQGHARYNSGGGHNMVEKSVERPYFWWNHDEDEYAHIGSRSESDDEEFKLELEVMASSFDGTYLIINSAPDTPTTLEYGEVELYSSDIECDAGSEGSDDEEGVENNDVRGVSLLERRAAKGKEKAVEVTTWIGDGHHEEHESRGEVQDHLPPGESSVPLNVDTAHDVLAAHAMNEASSGTVTLSKRRMVRSVSTGVEVVEGAIVHDGTAAEDSKPTKATPVKRRYGKRKVSELGTPEDLEMADVIPVAYRTRSSKVGRTILKPEVTPSKFAFVRFEGGVTVDRPVQPSTGTLFLSTTAAAFPQFPDIAMSSRSYEGNQGLPQQVVEPSRAVRWLNLQESDFTANGSGYEGDDERMDMDSESTFATWDKSYFSTERNPNSTVHVDEDIDRNEDVDSSEDEDEKLARAAARRAAKGKGREIAAEIPSVDIDDEGNEGDDSEDEAVMDSQHQSHLQPMGPDLDAPGTSSAHFNLSLIKGTAYHVEDGAAVVGSLSKAMQALSMPTASECIGLGAFINVNAGGLNSTEAVEIISKKRNFSAMDVEMEMVAGDGSMTTETLGMSQNAFMANKEESHRATKKLRRFE